MQNASAAQPSPCFPILAFFCSKRVQTSVMRFSLCAPLDTGLVLSFCEFISSLYNQCQCHTHVLSCSVDHDDVTKLAIVPIRSIITAWNIDQYIQPRRKQEDSLCDHAGENTAHLDCIAADMLVPHGPRCDDSHAARLTRSFPSHLARHNCTCPTEPILPIGTQARTQRGSAAHIPPASTQSALLMLRPCDMRSFVYNN